MDCVTEQTVAGGGKQGKNCGKVQRKGSREVNWSDGETSMLLDLLAEVQSRKQNPNGDGGYNDLEWSYIYTEFSKNNIHKRVLPSLKQRWKNLKCDFSFFRYMANRSGCGWNEDAHIPDVPGDAWTYLKESDPNRHKKYVNKTFPWYKRVEALYGKGIATGRSNITIGQNSSIPRSFAESLNSDEDDATTQQEVSEFSIPEFRGMMDGVEHVHEPVHEPVCESVDPVTNIPISKQVNLTENLTFSEPNHVNIPTDAPLHIPSQSRKRGINNPGESSRRTKLKRSVNCMDEFAERFLYQQQQRTDLIAQLGRVDHVHDQALDKLKSLELPAALHVDMEMCLGNSWIRGCFLKENDNERLRMLVDRAVASYQSGQLPLK